MAKIYNKNTWTDEVLAGSERYNILTNGGLPLHENAQIELSTGVITPGSPVNAQRMNNIENGIDALDGKVDGMENDIDALENDIDALENDIITLQTSSATTAWVTSYAQPLDADLTAIAGLNPAENDIIQRKSGAWTNRTMPQLAADMIDYTQSAIIYRWDDPGGTSLWTGTIVGTPSGASVTVSNPTSGQKAVLVPGDLTTICKLRLYNLTRNNHALIANYNPATNVVTLTSSVPPTWANGDSLTVASRFISGAGINWMDLEIVSTALNKSNLFLSCRITPNVAGALLMLIPTNGVIAVANRNIAGQVAGTYTEMHNVPINPINNIFTIAWTQAPSLIFLRLQGFIS